MPITEDELDGFLEADSDPYVGFKRIHNEFLFSLTQMEQLITQSKKRIEQIFEESDNVVELKIKKSDDKIKLEWRNYVDWRTRAVELVSSGRKPTVFLFESERFSKIFKTKINEDQKLVDSFGVFQVKFIGEMSLVYLVSKFESFLYDLLRYVFNLEPKILKFQYKDRTVTYDIIFDSKDIKNLKKSIAKKEAKKLIDDNNISDLVEALNDKINFPNFTKNGNNWKIFRNAFLRRNVIIHSDGILDEKYYAALKIKNASNTTTSLYVDQTYMTGIISLFRKYSNEINIFFVEKFAPDKEDKTK